MRPESPRSARSRETGKAPVAAFRPAFLITNGRRLLIRLEFSPLLRGMIPLQDSLAHAGESPRRGVGGTGRVHAPLYRAPFPRAFACKGDHSRHVI